MKTIDGQPGSYPVTAYESIGEYRKISTVFAVQLTEDAEIDTPEGRMFAKAGDYLAQHEDGHAWVIKREYFESTYEQVGEGMSAKAGDYLAQHEDGHAWPIKRSAM